jgi:hypothetical protein
MANEEPTSVEQLADDVYEAIRMINEQTRGARLPAPSGRVRNNRPLERSPW